MADPGHRVSAISHVELNAQGLDRLRQWYGAQQFTSFQHCIN